MKITKDTIRADGLTVGEAMERDREFLRSMGHKIPDTALMTIDEQLDAHVQKVREAVLDALDLAAGNKGNGWQDGDLPELFKAIDRQAKIQFERGTI